MATPLEPAIVRILNANGDTVGTGFIVNDWGK